MGLGDEGVAALVGHARLQTLNLSSSKISDNSIKSLVKLPALKELNLSFTDVSEDAVTEFRKAMPACDVAR